MALATQNDARNAAAYADVQASQDGRVTVRLQGDLDVLVPALCGGILSHGYGC